MISINHSIKKLDEGYKMSKYINFVNENIQSLYGIINDTMSSKRANFSNYINMKLNEEGEDGSAPPPPPPGNDNGGDASAPPPPPGDASSDNSGSDSAPPPPPSGDNNGTINQNQDDNQEDGDPNNGINNYLSKLTVWMDKLMNLFPKLFNTKEYTGLQQTKNLVEKIDDKSKEMDDEDYKKIDFDLITEAKDTLLHISLRDRVDEKLIKDNNTEINRKFSKQLDKDIEEYKDFSDNFNQIKVLFNKILESNLKVFPANMGKILDKIENLIKETKPIVDNDVKFWIVIKGYLIKEKKENEQDPDIIQNRQELIQLIGKFMSEKFKLYKLLIEIIGLIDKTGKKFINLK